MQSFINLKLSPSNLKIYSGEYSKFKHYYVLHKIIHNGC